MADTAARFFVFERAPANAEAFVRFWACCYEYPDWESYTPNIIGPLTREKLKALFKWKIGARFFESHWPKVERLFVARLDEALALPPDISASRLLELFAKGGAVYRIFWLHCLRPSHFPIYDQHVHRAMNVLEGTEHRELNRHTQTAQVRLYVDRYLPFWNQYFAGHDPRGVDQALWAFGKFMNEKRNTPFGKTTVDRIGIGS